MDITWRDRIVELERRGWSLTGLASSIGLSPQALSDIKHGRTKAPTGMAAVVLHRLHAVGALPAANDDAKPDPVPDKAGQGVPENRPQTESTGVNHA